MYNLKLYLPIVDNKVTIKGKKDLKWTLYLEEIPGQKERMRVKRGKYENRWVEVINNTLIISYRDLAHALGARVNSKNLRIAMEKMLKEHPDVIKGGI